MLPMEKSVTFTGACANEIIPIARLSTKRKKDVMLELEIENYFKCRNNLKKIYIPNEYQALW